MFFAGNPYRKRPFGNIMVDWMLILKQILEK
jgi:hypothetical protein